MENVILDTKSEKSFFDDELNPHIEFLTLNINNSSAVLTILMKDGVLLAEDMAIIVSN